MRYISLIIRPEEQAASLAKAIKAHGGQAFICPTIEIIDPPDLDSVQTKLGQLAQFDIAIFCTANAVKKSVAHVRGLPERINRAATRILAIGPGTAQALKAHNFVVDGMPEANYSSEGLLSLPELQHVKEKRIAVIAGVGGRTLLTATLTKRGAKPTKIETYDRRCPFYTISDKLAQWIVAGVNVIVSSSFLSLENLYRLLHDTTACEWLLTRYIVVVSKRMHQQARALGFRQFIFAENATDKAIVNALTKQEGQDADTK